MLHLDLKECCFIIFYFIDTITIKIKQSCTCNLIQPNKLQLFLVHTKNVVLHEELVILVTPGHLEHQLANSQQVFATDLEL
jgi:hypothetical protein